MPARVLYGDLSKYGYVTLALGRGGQAPDAPERFACASLEQLEDSLSGFLRARDADIDAAAFSACGWEQAGGLSMHNHNFSISRNWLKEVLHIQRLHLVNDCVAMAMAIDRSTTGDLVEIHAGSGDDQAVKGLIAAGIGLGTAMLTEEDGRSIVLPCEGGHSALPVAGDEEIEVARALRRRVPYLSRESAISFSGLAMVHAALGEARGETASGDGTDIVARARAGDALAARAVALLADWLAAMASDIVLLFGARGGIYLSGALVEQIGDLIDPAAFSKRYADKGRLSGYVSSVPVYHFTLPEQMILGLSTLFDYDFH
jgi:glucokinase